MRSSPSLAPRSAPAPSCRSPPRAGAARGAPNPSPPRARLTRVGFSPTVDLLDVDALGDGHELVHVGLRHQLERDEDVLGQLHAGQVQVAPPDAAAALTLWALEARRVVLPLLNGFE